MFGRTIQQGFEAAKNLGTRAVEMQPAAAPDAPVEPGVEETQPQMTNGVASPSQASVSDLTDDAPAQSATPVSAPQTPPATASAPADPSAELKIYDTSSQPLDQVLAQVQQDGASIVVGPLLKNNVEALMKSNTPLNVLALNQPETVRSFPNICYFALSPEDEARDAAHHIYDRGKQSPLLLIPRSALGDRVANAFTPGVAKTGRRHRVTAKIRLRSRAENGRERRRGYRVDWQSSRRQRACAARRHHWRSDHPCAADRRANHRRRTRRRGLYSGYAGRDWLYQTDDRHA